MLALPLFLALAFAPPSADSSLVKRQPPLLAIRVDRIVMPNGTIGAGGWIVVRNGRLEAVGAAAAPPGAQTLEFAGGVASPGFIDAVTELGASGDLEEPARAFTPEAQAADAFHAGHSAFLNAARGGITTVGLSPTSSNVVGGHLAIVRTSSEQKVATLVGPGPPRLALTSAAFNDSRAPTSRMGALPMLRDLLQGDALKSSGPLVVDVSTADEIRVTMETLSGAGRTVALLQPARADDALDSIKDRQAFAIVGPFGLASGERNVKLPQVLRGAGVAIAFTANGNAGSLRLTAALATRGGLAPEVAVQALTTVPARILGIDGDAGALEAGKRADVVVFDGDPLDLASKVKLVLVGGAPVEPRSAAAAPQKESP